MMPKVRRLCPGLLAVATLCVVPMTAAAAPFDYIRIGDLDGFGFKPTTDGLVRATPSPHTTPADTNGNNLLEVLEFLPDLNKNGFVATGNGDDFDNRSASEKSDSVISGNGFTNIASSGSKWTDVALSTSSTLGVGFPDPAGPGVPNEPQFVYDFHVAGADISSSAVLFFNVLFGDYDVVPANITLTFASAPTRTLALTTQANAADGLIQAAFANLAFGEVFTADGLGGWNGYLRVDFNAPNEPYTAFDFTELSTTPISVPEPTLMVLLGTGLVGLSANGRRRASR